MQFFSVLFVLSCIATYTLGWKGRHSNVKFASLHPRNGMQCLIHGKRSLTLQQHTNMQLSMNNNNMEDATPSPPVNKDGFDLAAWFNPSTRGGVIVWSFLLTLIPVGFYQYFVSTGMEETTVGAYVGAIFVLLSNVAWASTYIFRVANKDMTYAQQLKDYENAVLQKRLEELGDDEINALMEEIEEEERRN